jgi:hypothetical protein
MVVVVVTVFFVCSFGAIGVEKGFFLMSGLSERFAFFFKSRQ